jgi:hypothetical protein
MQIKHKVRYLVGEVVDGSTPPRVGGTMQGHLMGDVLCMS